MKNDAVVYPILLFRIDGVETSDETVASHISYVRSLDDLGKLVLAGPFKGFPGGMVIVRAESAEAAKEIADAIRL